MTFIMAGARSFPSPKHCCTESVIGHKNHKHFLSKKNNKGDFVGDRKTRENFTKRVTTELY